MKDEEKHIMTNERIRAQYEKVSGQKYKRPAVDPDKSSPMKLRDVVYSVIIIVIVLAVWYFTN